MSLGHEIVYLEMIFELLSVFKDIRVPVIDSLSSLDVQSHERMMKKYTEHG